MSWFRSVCKKSLSRKDRMQRHVMSKHRNAGLYPISNSSNVFTEMSVVSLRTLFYTLMIAGMTRVRKTGLGSISITTSFRDNLPSLGEDCLVLFTMAACVYRNASRHATH